MDYTLDGGLFAFNDIPADLSHQRHRLSRRLNKNRQNQLLNRHPRRNKKNQLLNRNRQSKLLKSQLKNRRKQNGSLNKLQKKGKPSEANEQQVKALEQLAKDGDPDAQSELGAVYAEGRYGQEKDEKRAIQLFKEAVGQGHVDAKVRLAKALSVGIGSGKLNDGSHIIKHGKEILQLFSEAADEGHPEAHFYLGQMYFSGIKTLLEADHKKAKEHFETALNTAPQGHYIINQSYQLLRIIVANEQRLTALEDRVQKGDPDAQYSLGIVYIQGRYGKKINGEKAIQLFREAVSQGHIDAKLRLAMALGLGVNSDKPK